MKFTWNEVKSEWAREHRGFNFDYASTVFFDAERIEGFSKRKEEEDRFFVIGRAALGEILYVVYTWRQHEEEQICRIISARIASRKERKRYSEVRE